MSTDTLLRTASLSLHFYQRYGVLKQHKNTIKAVDGVSLDILPGETLGLVGESGCGKSSLGKALLNLHAPTGGEVYFKEHCLTGLNQKQWRNLRPQMQMVFQDPFESLNPRHTVSHILEEPLIVHQRGNQAERHRRVEELLEVVGLGNDALNKYPHEFSGGQRQRIGIARAIALEPELLICDEAVSALDVSVQAQILNLLLDIQQKMHLAMLFISHDLSVVQHISDRIAVMYKGKLVEIGEAQRVCESPAHPYTRALLNAVPGFGKDWRKVEMVQGEISTREAEAGCAFAPRCPHAQARCLQDEPVLPETNETHRPRAACHFPLPHSQAGMVDS
ncbi:oligopeptide/dipeptide ABC transporter ATP-binding protein [Litorivivens lipolytica]|uniref:Oligopeptide/dipeptide ABC transporter ATP-binding protein n=1 Tax=Litorivivens lipolytica TaxID=1524264 RepID=A0A7W4W2X8_9GAMM|nr:oligopeptide/dipeptide ABC transporter ATP-binding protein [Litorivivens lipolytica]MBB3046461.1 oligopeptide/dipeptide ABC transporter ATP-binding protein [Litorivivens lipolytica]